MWVSRPKNLGELTKNFGELSKKLGELTNFYLGELVFGWGVLIPTQKTPTSFIYDKKAMLL